jgi:hypothetical protein
MRGRVAVKSDSTHVVLEVDPEGSASCVLTVQDANEIAGFIAEHAKVLWEASGRAQGPQPSAEGTPRSYRLRTESGALVLAFHDTQSLIALSHEDGNLCKLTVAQAVAFVQIVQYMIKENPRP